jgi:hypothetical protein
VSGCALLLPDPSHREIITNEASRSNLELTDTILNVLAAERLVHCNIGRRVPEKLVVIVKGQGPYFSDLPNREVAVRVANMLREQL